MELQLSGKNVEITQQIRDYVTRKLKRLNRYLTDIKDVKIEILQENTRLPKDRYRTQITLISRGSILRSEERASNINLSIDKVVKILARQIHQFKGRLIKRGRGTNIPQEQEKTVEEYRTRDASHRVVRIKRFPVKSMSVDEAIDQMELLSHDFYLFVNEDSDALNLVYRRKAGNYGIIEPQID
jgi:putative sigma-54 modulation protein